MTTDPRLLDPALEPAPVDWNRVDRLEWIQPRLLSRRWVLVADGEPAMTLEQHGFWNRDYLARSHAAEWKVLEPFWGPTRVTRGEESEAEIVATFHFPLEHRLARAAGEPLVWARRGWTSFGHVLETREKFPLLAVRESLNPLTCAGRVELHEAARGLPDLAALVALTWVLQLRSHRARTR